MLRDLYLCGIVGAFEKFALEPEAATTLTSLALGGARLTEHGPWEKGYKSKDEVEAEKELKKKKLEGAKKHHQAVVNAENAGAGLAGSGALLAGLAGSKIFGKLLVKGEKKQRTTLKDLARLEKEIIPGTTSESILHKGGVSGAYHIPKGGLLPGVLKPVEKWFFRNRNMPPKIKTKTERKQVAEQIDELFERIYEKGLQSIPRNTGPHVAAHEMGHNWFGGTPGGKVVRALRTPAAIAGPMAASYMALQDPDSTESKLAPVVGGLGVLPTLGEEAAASLKGYHAMKQLGYSPKRLATARGQLAKAFGTYAALHGALNIGGPMAMRGARKYFINKRKEHGLPTSKETGKKLEKLEAKKKK